MEEIEYGKQIAKEFFFSKGNKSIIIFTEKKYIFPDGFKVRFDEIKEQVGIKNEEMFKIISSPEMVNVYDISKSRRPPIATGVLFLPAIQVMYNHNGFFKIVMIEGERNVNDFIYKFFRLSYYKDKE